MPVDCEICELEWKKWCESLILSHLFLDESRPVSNLSSDVFVPGEPRQAQSGWNAFIQLSSSRDAAGHGYSKIQRLGPV